MTYVPNQPRRPGALATWVQGLGETVVTAPAIRRRISSAVKAGLLRPLDRGIYTRNLQDDPAVIVRRNLWDIAGALFPNAVVSFRTAFEAQPTEVAGIGHIWLTWKYPRVIALPGHAIHLIRGPLQLPGDVRYVGGLYLASEARQTLENLSRARTVDGVTRAVPRPRIEHRLAQILGNRGEAGLNRLRDEARGLSSDLGQLDSFHELDRLIGALMGTRTAAHSDPTARARAVGRPVDSGVIARLDALFSHLHSRTFPAHPDVVRAGTPWENIAFFDAYFSNFIEGTTFELPEAEEIIFRNKVIPRRDEDSHDIMGTYRVLVDPHGMQQDLQSFHDGAAFLGCLRERHRLILSGRPGKAPGEFKAAPNRAGETAFTPPELVEGTLLGGYERGRSLQDPFARAVFSMALITEVHPFADGNGRVARASMNAELIASGERRILVPTVYREDYLGGLREFTRRGNVDLLPRVMQRAWDFSAAIDFQERRSAEAAMTRCNAFRESGEARLRLPSEVE